MSLNETIRPRLHKDRPMTSITLRIPADVVESMKHITPLRGFSGYQPLLRSYIGEGLHRDEAAYLDGNPARWIDALRKHGVPDEVIEAAAKEAA